MYTIQPKTAVTADRLVADDSTTNRLRSVSLCIPGHPAADGDGVQLTRFIGTPAQPMLDPFLLLDMLYADTASTDLGGFPDHPHRGFETVTYVLGGRVCLPHPLDAPHH